MNKKEIQLNIEDACLVDDPKVVQFLTDLFAFQRKYPECYIEAWTPEDYKAASKMELSKGQQELVSTMLYNTCDVTKGTTWDKVKQLVEDVKKNYEDA